MRKIKKLLSYITSFIKWLIISCIVGVLGGATGSVFHILLDNVTLSRENNNLIIFLLPFGGMVIALMYNYFKSKGSLDTNCVIKSAKDGSKVPLVLMPLIFTSTLITHLFGGSAGREGAALQLGGSIGYNVGKIFKTGTNDTKIIVMAGMSSVFSALFGTPLTAAVFSIEIAFVGMFNPAAFLPCVISAFVAYLTALQLGVSPVIFPNVTFGALTVDAIIRVIILALLCALVGIAFCVILKKCNQYMATIFKNAIVRAVVGGIIIIALTYAVRTFDYNGAGMNVITNAIEGNARWNAFILKIVFTAITMSAGFKGGEIVPSFFIGATFGCVVGPLLGLNASISAALGFVCVFCSVVNCPIAAIILSIEVFGVQGLAFFAIACAVSNLMSGNFSLYNEQKVLYSKI